MWTLRGHFKTKASAAQVNLVTGPQPDSARLSGWNLERAALTKYPSSVLAHLVDNAELIPGLVEVHHSVRPPNRGINFISAVQEDDIISSDNLSFSIDDLFQAPQVNPRLRDTKDVLLRRTFQDFKLDLRQPVPLLGSGFLLGRAGELQVKPVFWIHCRSGARRVAESKCDLQAIVQLTAGVVKKISNVLLQRLPLEECRAENRSLIVPLWLETDRNPAEGKVFPATIPDDAVFHLVQDFPPDFQRSARRATPEDFIDPFLDLVFRPQESVQESHILPFTTKAPRPEV
jgi:hypothetical protein